MLPIFTTVNRLDSQMYRWCMSRKRAAQVAALSRHISRLGDGPFYILLGVTILWLEDRYGAEYLLAGINSFTIELPLYLLCKNIIRRPRPCDVIVDLDSFIKPSDKFSCPSGHTAAAFVMASLCNYYYPEFGLFSYLLAMMIGISRILLGVHYPTDILAGMILGLFSFQLAQSISGG